MNFNTKIFRKKLISPFKKELILFNSSKKSSEKKNLQNLNFEYNLVGRKIFENNDNNETIDDKKSLYSFKKDFEPFKINTIFSFPKENFDNKNEEKILTEKQKDNLNINSNYLSKENNNINSLIVRKNFTLIDKSQLNICHCSKSSCNKLYCECYRNKRKCINCSCIGCKNIYNEKEKNINNNIEFSIDKKSINNKYLGCTCSKSNCNKKYCECFKKGKKCDNNCRCIKCNNNLEEKYKIENIGGFKVIQNKAEIINLINNNEKKLVFLGSKRKRKIKEKDNNINYNLTNSTKYFSSSNKQKKIKNFNLNKNVIKKFKF
jgi:hypothetical protein